MKTILILTLTTILKMIPSPIHKHTLATPYFIAMEYKGLLNCTMKIYVTDSLIMGAKVNGYITCYIGNTVPMKHVWEPEAYVKKKLDSYDDLLTDESAFLKRDNYNFIIRRSDITKVWYDPTHKWGMGYYPDTGKIYLESKKSPGNHKTIREFILVGKQDAQSIMEMLNK